MHHAMGSKHEKAWHAQHCWLSLVLHTSLSCKYFRNAVVLAYDSFVCHPKRPVNNALVQTKRRSMVQCNYVASGSHRRRVASIYEFTCSEITSKQMDCRVLLHSVHTSQLSAQLHFFAQTVSALPWILPAARSPPRRPQPTNIVANAMPTGKCGHIFASPVLTCASNGVTPLACRSE